MLCFVVRNYLTRRIRFHVYGTTFQAVQEKQITIPLIIPHDLEDFLVQQTRERYPDLPLTSSPLIPLHDATRYDAATSTLPSLRDITTEEGNLRYWVITNTSMWAGQHRALDEMFHVLWSLHSLFRAAPPSFDPFGPRYLQEWYKSRYADTLDEDCRDLLLFRQWVLPTPLPSPVGRFIPGLFKPRFHPLFNEKVIKYPFPNELFWKDGDEGERDYGEGVAEWRLSPINLGERNTPAEQFYDPNGLRNGRPSPSGWDDIRDSPFYKDHIDGTEKEDVAQERQVFVSNFYN